MAMTDLAQNIYPETEAAARVDRLEAELKGLPPCDMPLVHRFTKGMYIREIFMPQGALVISKIHTTEHPFTILKGSVKVWMDGEGVQHLKAPHIGITRPGTRRVLFITEDCVWVTFHATNLTDPQAVEDEIILKRPTTVQAQGLIPQGIINELIT